MIVSSLISQKGYVLWSCQLCCVRGTKTITNISFKSRLKVWPNIAVRVFFHQKGVQGALCEDQHIFEGLWKSFSKELGIATTTLLWNATTTSLWNAWPDAHRPTIITNLRSHSNCYKSFNWIRTSLVLDGDRYHVVPPSYLKFSK
jgi:hypothetical protein